jgi:hypothetical protein
MGQYKGDPFETDYGKLKSKTSKPNSDSEESSGSDDSKEPASTETKAPKDAFGGKKAEPFKTAPKTEEKKNEPTEKAADKATDKVSTKPVEKKEEPKTENAKPFVKKTEKVAATTGR